MDTSSRITITELDNPNLHSGADLFASICQRPWAMLLDSADSNHPDSRWDILALDPVMTLTADQTDCVITQPETSDTHLVQGDPLALLQSLLDRCFSTANEQTKRAQPAIDHSGQPLPFSGGALGLAGYDLGWAFERLPALPAKEVDIPDLAFGIYPQALLIEQSSRRALLISRPLATDSNLQSPSCQVQLWQSLLNQPSAEHPASTGCETFSLNSAWQTNLDRDAYASRFDQVQAYLHSGDCYQVNLARRFSADCSGFPWPAYRALRDANRGPFSAFINLPQGQILSVSPERFLQVRTEGENGTQLVETRPIKGTRPRLPDSAADQAQIRDLRSAPKDRAENLMIVDLLRNDLSRNCQSGTVQVPELFAVESFPAVHHLVSTVTGTLRPDRTSLDLLRDAFPGGSITGAPKIRAMEIIHQLEPHRRHSYCGSVVALSADGTMDSSITIRTLVCSNNQLHCWAGGGLVADSDQQSEFEETEHKLGRILPLLEQFRPSRPSAGADAAAAETESRQRRS